jgi:hypothetical protein
VLTIRRRTKRAGGGEAGSTLVIATLVMMVLSTLSLGVLARTLRMMSFVRNGQDFDAALAVADAGLADAVHTLDTGGRPDVGTHTGAAGGGAWTYAATRANDGEYDIRSLGVVGASRHAVRARVTRGSKYPFTLFADESLDLGPGGVTLGLSSWLSLGQPDTRAVHIGTNGPMIVQPGDDAGDFQHIYPPNGSCSGCGPATLVRHTADEGSYALPAVTEPTGPTQSCPLLGAFTGVVNGQSGKPFVCKRNVALSGTVTVVNPPFVLYVLPSASGAASSLDLRTAVVNAGLSASNVEIRKAGTAPLLLDLTSTPLQLTFSGVLYAPDTALRIQGSKWWSGSVVVDTVEVVNGPLGAPLLTLGYDLNLANSYLATWTVSRYREIPASEAGV